MHQFFIRRSNEGIKEMTSESGNFYLLGEDQNLEIIKLDIKKGKSLLLLPDECVGKMALFYILSGRLVYSVTGEEYGTGASISAKDIQHSECFETLEDSALLWVIQRPMFEFQTQFSKDLSTKMSAIQEKDHYTEQHCNDTGNLLSRMGALFKLESQAMIDIIFAAKIHDIGKINVPEVILKKPAALDQAEWCIMKKHSADGYDMIKDQMPERVARIVLEHHEKCNGSGYPKGITCSEMLLESRMLAVVDAFSAITADRPYRRAMTQESAYALLNKDRDVLWDGQVLDALKKVIQLDI